MFSRSAVSMAMLSITYVKPVIQKNKMAAVKPEVVIMLGMGNM